MTDFAVWVVSPTVVKAYKDGALHAHNVNCPVRSGPYTSIVALETSGFHTTRIEWRNGGPFGSLVGSFDFNNLTGWSPGNGGGAINPAGELEILGGSFSQWVYTATPAGADYAELFGCYFDAPLGADFWGMISLHHDGVSEYGEQGYRVLMNEFPPHDLQIVDGDPFVDSGWIVVG